MAPIATRRAGNDDIAAVAVLFDAYRQFYEMPADLEGARAYVRARIEASESVVFVAEDGVGELAGFCQLYPTYCSVFMAPIYVLYDLFVTPGTRRSGIGRALLAAAEQHALQSGAVRMELRTARTNRAAHSLYEGLGWRRDEMFYAYSKKVVSGQKR